MVAYSFHKRFRAPILSNTKRQTIRGDRKRHARVHEPVQLYTGMRTQYCSPIGLAECISTEYIRIELDRPGVFVGDMEPMLTDGERNAFAVSDGFYGWADMTAFWEKAHPGQRTFCGVLIRWRNLKPGDWRKAGGV